MRLMIYAALLSAALASCGQKGPLEPQRQQALSGLWSQPLAR